MREHPYLFIIIKLLPGGWGNHLERMDKKLYEDNRIDVVMMNVKSREVWLFSRNNCFEE